MTGKRLKQVAAICFFGMIASASEVAPEFEREHYIQEMEEDSLMLHLDDGLCGGHRLGKISNDTATGTWSNGYCGGAPTDC